MALSYEESDSELSIALETLLLGYKKKNLYTISISSCDIDPKGPNLSMLGCVCVCVVCMLSIHRQQKQLLVLTQVSVPAPYLYLCPGDMAVSILLITYVWPNTSVKKIARLIQCCRITFFFLFLFHFI